MIRHCNLAGRRVDTFLILTLTLSITPFTNQVMLIKRCNLLDEELAQAKKKTNTDTGVIEYLRKQVAELQEERRAKNEDAWKDREIERLKGLMEEMRRQIQGLQDEKQELLAVVETLKEGITAYKSQMANTESKRKVTGAT